MTPSKGEGKSFFIHICQSRQKADCLGDNRGEGRSGCAHAHPAGEQEIADDIDDAGQADEDYRSP